MAAAWPATASYAARSLAERADEAVARPVATYMLGRRLCCGAWLWSLRRLLLLIVCLWLESIPLKRLVVRRACGSG